MELYNLIIYKIIVFYIPQKNRNIKKTYYRKVGIITDISKNDVSKKVIELYQQLDTNYIIIDVNKNNINNEIYDYYEKLNKKSLKMYLELTNNKELLKINLDLKEKYFKIKYAEMIDNICIVKKLLKDIDVMK